MYSTSWETYLRAKGRHLPYMGSRSVTYHPTQVNAPRLNSSQTGRYGYSIYLAGGMEGWVDIGSLIAIRPGVEPTTAWSQVRRPNRYATKPPVVKDPKSCSRISPILNIHWLKINERIECKLLSFTYEGLMISSQPPHHVYMYNSVSV